MRLSPNGYGRPGRAFLCRRRDSRRHCRFLRRRNVCRLYRQHGCAAEDSALDYFVHQLLFSLAVEANPRAAALYAEMPTLVQDPTHALWYDYADQPFDEVLLHEICAKALFQKLNYKTPSALNPVPGSVADHLLAPYR